MPKSYQIALNDEERRRLINRIEYDWQESKAAHQARSDRFASYLKRWEARVSPARAGEERKPNHPFPVTRWNAFQKIARDIQALFGDKASIYADPVGPSDYEAARKVSAYMTNRVFAQMKLVLPMCEFEFRRVLFGRAIAYRPWWRREFNVLDNGRVRRACDYEGPGFFPAEPDDIVVPGERGVTDIQDFSFTIRRVRVTVDELQHGDGTLYQGTSDRDFVERAIQAARRGRSDIGTDPVREEQERSKGVQFDQWTGTRAARSLWMWEWYGYWRPLKKQKRDGEQDDLERRLPFEADWVIRYLPDMKEIIGCQDLLELYPKMRRRRPFVDSSMVKDGTYWSMGFGQMLEDVETEGTVNNQLLTAAGELSVWPIVFYKPGGGMSPKAMKMDPGMMIPTEDPSGVNVVTFRPNLEYCLMKNQDTLSNGERTTGITDQSMGRSIDRPNAPRTATGQLALIEEGNVRAYLDATILREDIEQIVEDIWNLDSDLAPKTNPGLWFRVTESSMEGPAGFDVQRGGAYMTPQEFGGTYDFRLKLAVSAYSREAQAQKVITLYDRAMLNPVVASNPVAMWQCLNRLAEALGVDNFEALVPAPPMPDLPKTPDEEWNLMLEGNDEVNPNPQDNDDLHLVKHLRQLADSRNDPAADVQARNLLVHHIMQTREQKAAKMAMQALTQQMIQSIQPQGGAGAPDIRQVLGGVEQGGMPAPPGMPPGMPPATGPAAGPQLGGPPMPGPAAPAGADMNMPLPGGGIGSQAAPTPVEGML